MIPLSGSLHGLDPDGWLVRTKIRHRPKRKQGRVT